MTKAFNLKFPPSFTLVPWWLTIRQIARVEVNEASFPASIAKPMSKPRPKAAFPLNDAFFSVKARKPVPHEFVLDALAPLSPRTRPMFGCLAVYVREKIVFILQDKQDYVEDNGLWL